jgi:hypothetical protein
VRVSMMEQMELFVSWMREAVDGMVQNAFDPKSWGVLFAVLVLISIWSIVRALNRLTRQFSSTVAELSEIRSILKKVERSVESGNARSPSNDRGETDILNLPLREKDDRRFPP